MFGTTPYTLFDRGMSRSVQETGVELEGYSVELKWLELEVAPSSRVDDGASIGRTISCTNLDS